MMPPAVIAKDVRRLFSSALKTLPAEPADPGGAPRPRRLAATGLDALTSGELRVVSMAAEGLQNKEVARALFVTVRTVEMHLSNAYRKLGIFSREELAAALLQTD